MLDTALIIGDAMREVDRRNAIHLAHDEAGFNASFILSGQIAGEPPRLFRIYAEGNFIEDSPLTPYLQAGKINYGKSVLDCVITESTSIGNAAKCALDSFHSTMRQGFEPGDAYFETLGKHWAQGTREAFRRRPDLEW